MIIAIISDTHDNLTKIDQALKAVKKAKAEVIIHAGDFVSPFSLTPFKEAGLPVHAVIGNNDGERDGLRRQFAAMNARFWEGPVLFELGGLEFALQHQPYTAAEFAQHLAACTKKPAAQRGGSLNAKASLVKDLLQDPVKRILIYGHTHQLKIEKHKGLIVINPGECCGWLTGKSTIVILNTESLETEVIEL